MHIHLIWAQDRHGAIGKDNTLPWRLAEDLRHFKARTLGRPVVMGRKTFESLPGGPLPGRQNIVMSASTDSNRDPLVAYASSMEAAFEIAVRAASPMVYVIGGAQVYRMALPFAEVLEVTEVDVAVEEPDAFAPSIPPEFHLVKNEPWLTASTGLRYRFLKYVREGTPRRERP